MSQERQIVKKYDGKMAFEPPLKVKVERGKWTGADLSHNSRASYESKLIVPHSNSLVIKNPGHMCCMGFLLEELGVPRHRILGRALPTECNLSKAECESDDLFDFFCQNIETDKAETDLEGCLAITNDHRNVEPGRKEETIKKIGERFGIEFEFTGEVPQS